MRFTVITYGCQMNERDSEVIGGLMMEAGHTPSVGLEDADAVIVNTDLLAEADLVILNTCCVRATAENRILGRLGELKRLKKRNPSVMIAVGGCMTQYGEAASRIAKCFPHVDVVFGTHNMHEVPRMLETAAVHRRRVIAVPAGDASEWGCDHPVPSMRMPGVTALVTVMYGCDNFCSYCVVPYVRGRERSRDPNAILDEVREAVRSGYREVMLLGQNVNAYGKGLADGIDFAGLLGLVDDVPGVERIRYMTSHPRDFTDRIIRAAAESRHVCEHFHLPVQAGSDRVLRLMRRGYTRAQYMDLVARIREIVPGASVTTDIMVGFPGESERDFEDTLDLVRVVRFDMAYTFAYSPRKGTAAEGMPDQVPPEERRRRLSALVSEINPIALAKNRELVGHTVEILVEGPSRKDAGVIAGRTRTNKVVLVRSCAATPGELVNVRVSGARTWTLEAEPIVSPRDMPS
ncbi:MAG: tRNA (N6-isopentenyl adenosine(37)-C2)-methylthiotransferase MiaB [Firmicutes bacterium]|nr:tRNA (N6-isopentenyl adenosine(37)-C2)-methylthiotransferase MiaB [Bacillota bacterium]